MEFTIKEPLTREGIPDTFVVEMYWRHGDADKSTLTMSRPFKRNRDEWALEELLLTLDEINELVTEDYYDHVGYSKWFELYNYDFTEEDEARYAPFKCLEVEYDVSAGQGFASLQNYKVYYYDESLNKCLVEIDYN